MRGLTFTARQGKVPAERLSIVTECKGTVKGWQDGKMVRW